MRRVRGFLLHRPLAVVLAMVGATVVLAGFASQSVMEEGVAVENEYSTALGVLDERFGDPQAVLQVMFQTNGTDVRSAGALDTSLAIQSAIEKSGLDDTLSEGDQQPPLVSFLAAAEFVAVQRDLDPDELSDEQVRELDRDGREQLPPQVAGLLDELVSPGEPPGAGLLLAFQDTSDLTDEQILDRQRQLAEVVRSVDVPLGLAVSPLSLELLLEDNEIGGEIGRLFGTALTIILIVLAAVYWLRPTPGRRGIVLRRTLADVGLSLLTILFAVVWMQGLGVLLGPDFAGLIGYFDAQTQVVPILVVALGVDFAIHLLARYRSEVGTTGAPDRAYATAFGTVGLALLLDTTATAMGFLTNLVSPVEFLTTLGVLAACGIVAAFVLSMTFLPAARVMLDHRAVRRDRLPTEELAGASRSVLPRLMSHTVWLAERIPVATLATAVLLTAAGVYGFTQLDSRFALTDFVPQDNPQLETFEALQERFDGGFAQRTQVLLTGDLAQPESHNRLIAAIDRAEDVAGVQSGSGPTGAASLASVLEQATSDDGLGAELAELGVREDLTVREGTDVVAAYELLLDEAPSADQVLARDGESWFGRLELPTSVDQDEAGHLRDDLAAAFAPLDATGVEAIPASQQIVQASVSEDIEDAQLRSILIALGAVTLLLAAYFAVRRRQPWIGVLTVLPVGFVLALTFGMMAATGIPLNPVTATLAALSIGIGVPFTIHVSSRYLEERESAAREGTALRRAISQTGGAVVASALTTAVGFGVLTTSTLLPFEQLGYVIVYAIVFSAIAATVVLPCLLALWERRQTPGP